MFFHEAAHFVSSADHEWSGSQNVSIPTSLSSPSRFWWSCDPVGRGDHPRPGDPVDRHDRESLEMGTKAGRGTNSGSYYCKIPLKSDTRKTYCNHPRIWLIWIFSSLEWKAHLWAYRQASVVRCLRRPHSSNIFSEITGQIKVKFLVEPLWDGGTKVCSNGPGQFSRFIRVHQQINGRSVKGQL